MNYNVSQFLQTYTYDHHKVERMNAFTVRLDELMHVSKSDPRYILIYSGKDTIMERLMLELASLDPVLALSKLRATGSISSNVKVGLPHEADYVCELPDGY